MYNFVLYTLTQNFTYFLIQLILHSAFCLINFFFRFFFAISKYYLKFCTHHIPKSFCVSYFFSSYFLFFFVAVLSVLSFFHLIIFYRVTLALKLKISPPPYYQPFRCRNNTYEKCYKMFPKKSNTVAC